MEPTAMDEAGKAVPTKESPLLTDPDSTRSSLDEPTGDNPPAFGEHYGQVAITNESLDTKLSITDDGRVNIKLSEKASRLSKMAMFLDRQGSWGEEMFARLDKEHYNDPPPLNIVIQVIGSRGDIQPFIALGKALKGYGHHVRIATHPTFREFVRENDLEFFSVGGDPAELMSYMVRNPGLIPGLESIRAGDIGARRKGMYEMMVGFWLSCITPSEDSDSEFLVDAIIANPPSYAGIHCAEKLGIPLHLMFTMPWSPTHEFPHPLANIKSTNLEPNITNLMSYPMVDLLTWQGLGDVVNKFRKHILRIEELSPIWAPSLIQRAKIPYTYCWSPALIPKPKDWGAHIDISGFFFLDLAEQYKPSEDLAKFLREGPPPVYIGFGSIVVDDPAALTKLIFDAVKELGVRALVSKGWGGLGGDELPENIFMLGNVPHDWLFKQVSAVVHHGGAGTTAIGLRLGKPTVIVPFFGDQTFWARMVYAAGAGPEPQPFKTLTAEKLASAIRVALAPEATAAAAKLAERITHEKGAPTAAESFHRMLPLKQMRCSMFPKKLAVWKVRRTKIRISSYVAIVLLEHKYIESKDLKPYLTRAGGADVRCHYWQLEVNDGPYEPLFGVAGSLIASIGSVAAGFGTMLAAPPKAIYTAAIRSHKGSDSETSSIISTTETSRDSPEKTRRKFLGATEMKRSKSDQSDLSSTYRRTESMECHQLKKDLGSSGLGRVLKATIDAPIDFTVAMAQGWHNLPMLYGQKVRRVDPITDFSSGFKTGGKEMGLGFYDGLSRFFLDPIRGARDDGGLGFLRGLGSGTLDLIVRSSAGLWALPAYTLKGMQVATRNHRYKHEFRGILGKRLLRGADEFRRSSHEERQVVLRLWKSMGFEAQIKKRGELKDDPFPCPLHGCHLIDPHIHETDETGTVRREYKIL